MNRASEECVHLNECDDKTQCLTLDLGVKYLEWKEAEAEKNELRESFFEFANSALLKGELAEKLFSTENAEGETDEMVIERVRRHNPGWLVDEWRKKPLETDCYLYEVILYENEKLKPYTYVNRIDGRVYARTISAGSPMLDDDYLQRADRALYEEISFELPWGERVVAPLTTLSAEKLAKVQSYLYRKEPSPKLAAPRKAKPEELVDN